MRKILLVMSAFAVLLLVTTEALASYQGNIDAQGRAPTIYNRQQQQVGYISRIEKDGTIVMLPSAMTLGMGRWPVVIKAENLKPRERGGWETDLTNDQIAYLPPPDERFWMPSGY
jgi:hypothetical protein